MPFIMNCMGQSKERRDGREKRTGIILYAGEVGSGSPCKKCYDSEGDRIRNIGPEQTMEKTGVLAGLSESQETTEILREETASGELPVIPEKMLVFCGFGRQKLEELLFQLRRAGAPAIPMKAVLTEQNSKWSLYELYQELLEEHAKMSGNVE